MSVMNSYRYKETKKLSRQLPRPVGWDMRGTTWKNRKSKWRKKQKSCAHKVSISSKKLRPGNSWLKTWKRILVNWKWSLKTPKLRLTNSRWSSRIRKSKGLKRSRLPKNARRLSARWRPGSIARSKKTRRWRSKKLKYIRELCLRLDWIKKWSELQMRSLSNSTRRTTRG